MLPNIGTTKLDVQKTDGMFTIALIPPTLLDGFWKVLKTELEKDPTLWNKGQSVESIRCQIELGELLLWVIVKDGCVYLTFLTMFYQYATSKSLQIVWAMGSGLEKYIAMSLSALETYALATGCSQVEIIGRMGWKKPLMPFNYIQTQTTFVKTLQTERMN